MREVEVADERLASVLVLPHDLLALSGGEHERLAVGVALHAGGGDRCEVRRCGA